MTITPVPKGQLVPRANGNGNGHGNGNQPAPVKSYARIPQALEVPNLILSQTDSYEWFRGTGLKDVFAEVSPITDYTGKKYELHFREHSFAEPKQSPLECKAREVTYSEPLTVKTQLVMKETGEVKEQDIFMGDIPKMTENGTFIINGAERVVVSQLVRSPGVYFKHDRTTQKDERAAQIIPSRGAWLEFDTSARDVLSVKVDRKRKVSVTSFLRALGYATDEEILDLFAEVDSDEQRQYVRGTLERDAPVEERELNIFREEDLRNTWECISRWRNPEGDEAVAAELAGQYDSAHCRRIAAAQIDFYRKMRPGEPPSLENSQNLLNGHFFDRRRYDIGEVGRYKFNMRLRRRERAGLHILTPEDIVNVIRNMILVNRGEGRTDNIDQLARQGLLQDRAQGMPDNIDHLGNRRVRSVGELVQNQVRIGLLRMERMVKEKMTLVEQEVAAPQSLVNIRPVVAAVREFFGGSQLSQFMDQTNPLAELTHKRRLSALGPGGLSRERAGFDVRDVHFSHYGRICPIETPEGPNIGLLSSLSSYANMNRYGFIESPYRKVRKTIENTAPDLEGRQVTEAVKDESGKTLVGQGQIIRRNRVRAIQALPAGTLLQVKPYVPTDPGSVVYLPANEEENHYVAQANARLDGLGQFEDDRVEVRRGEDYSQESPELVDYMDVSPMQIMSISAALIPFLEHDDANRALMGSNMQRQAVPLLRPQVPVVGTGIEDQVARDSGQVVLSQVDGVVTSVSGVSGEKEGKEVVIVVTDADGEEHAHTLVKFSRTNQGTCFDQRPIVQPGDRVRQGDTLADSSSTDGGKLALGQNVLVAFMSWEGYNYEDAIIISERLVRDDRFTSVHIEKYEMESRETKLGPEEITRDIPNVGEASLRDLDERGIIRTGADVGPGDILVGKVTPKGETELTAEEKLLRAIFGEKSRDVKDTSLRVPHGERGKVIDVKILSREQKHDLSPGVSEAVRVWIAQTRKISVGDKMAGRHGNKGVVSRILAEEDMPYLADGTPVDMILNPIGVPSRMNLGQVLETHLGWAARGLNFRAVTPVFDGATDDSIEDDLARFWFAEMADAVDAGPTDGSPSIDYAKTGHWLAERGYDPAELFDESPARRGYAREVCLRLWLREVAGVKPDGLDFEELQAECLKVHREQRNAPGKTGGDVARDDALARQWIIEQAGAADPRQWLEEKGFAAAPVFDHAVTGAASAAALRIWLKEAAGVEADGLSATELYDEAFHQYRQGNIPPIRDSLDNRECKQIAPPVFGKLQLYDGRTGDPFDQVVTVGSIYMLKLIHLVEDKIHARSTGPYSMITQQPLGGKAQFGGQRFGEMEVWALEAYSAAYNLQEVLTVKADDMTGRVKTYESIVKGEPISGAGVPESFNVLLKELQSLGLAMELLSEDDRAALAGAMGDDTELYQTLEAI